MGKSTKELERNPKSNWENIIESYIIFVSVTFPKKFWKLHTQYMKEKYYAESDAQKLKNGLKKIGENLKVKIFVRNDVGSLARAFLTNLSVNFR